MSNPSSLLNRLLARGKFRHIQVLLQLAELGSVQRAADAIGVTQSAATQALAYLEDLLEVRLFERHARGVRPTPACLDLLPAARQLMRGLTQGADSVAARRRQGEGVVRLVASAAGSCGLLADALPAFAAAHPAITVLLTEAEGDDQLQAVARGEVDMAVCRRRAVTPEHWEFHALQADRMVIVCRPAHPIGRRPRAWSLALSQHAWLIAPAGTATRTHFEELAQRLAKVPPTHPVVTRALGLMWSLLQQADLLALLPFTVVRSKLSSGELEEVRIDAEMALEPIGLLRSTTVQGAATTSLCEFLSTFRLDKIKTRRHPCASFLAPFGSTRSRRVDIGSPDRKCGS